MATLLAAAPAAALTLEGLYRPAYEWAKDWDCRSVGQDGGAVILTSNAFIGVGSRCSLSNPVDVVGMEARFYYATCSGEGRQVRKDRIMILKTQFGIAIIRRGAISQFVSCADAEGTR